MGFHYSILFNEWPKSQKFIVKVALIGSIGGLLYGYDLGVISQALPLLTDQFSLSIPEQELMTSLLIIGSIFGSLFGGSICDYIGRKKTIYCVCLIFMCGSSLLTFSQTLTQLYIGRFIVGIGVAISAIADVSYLNEVSPDSHRGAIVGTNELMITIGLLSAYFIDYFFIDLSYGWRVMFFVPVIMSFVWSILMIPMPESPTWYLCNDMDEQALKVYQERSESESEAQSEFDAAKAEIMETKEADEIPLWPLLISWRHSIFVSVFIILACNLSGQVAVLTYAPNIFQAAGLGRHSAAVAVVLLGVLKVIFTGVSMAFVDSVGRVPVLLTGVIGMCVALVGIISFVGTENSDGSTSGTLFTQGLCIFFIALMVSSFAIGFGPISWLLSSELFPDDIRGRTFGLVTVSNGVGSLISVSTFLTLLDRIGARGTFSIALAVCVMAVLFIIRFVPEPLHRHPIELKSELVERFKRPFRCPNIKCSFDGSSLEEAIQSQPLMKNGARSHQSHTEETVHSISNKSIDANVI